MRAGQFSYGLGNSEDLGPAPCLGLHEGEIIGSWKTKKGQKLGTRDIGCHVLGDLQLVTGLSKCSQEVMIIHCMPWVRSYINIRTIARGLEQSVVWMSWSVKLSEEFWDHWRLQWYGQRLMGMKSVVVMCECHLAGQRQKYQREVKGLPCWGPNVLLCW